MQLLRTIIEKIRSLSILKTLGLARQLYIVSLLFLVMAANAQEICSFNTNNELGLNPDNGTFLAAGTVIGQTKSIVCYIGADDYYKPQSATFTINGTEITGGFQGLTNPKDIDGGVPSKTLQQPTRGAFLKFEAKADGFLYVMHKASSNRAYTVFENGTAIGYTFAAIGDAASELGVVYQFSLEGTGWHNQVKTSIEWAEQEYLKFTAPDKYASHWNYNNDGTSVWDGIKVNGLGVIKFPVYAGYKYIVNANGSKITSAGYAFNPKDNLTIMTGDIVIWGESVGNDPTPTDFADQYLTFVARESGTFKFSGNSVSYSLDNGNTWNTLASDTNSPTVQSGQKIMWKGMLTPSSSSPYGIGTFSASTQYEAEGNPMSLLYGDNFAGKTSGGVFSHLFDGCVGLVSINNLKLVSTEHMSYRYMFRGCTSLTSLPSGLLPATRMSGESCYGYMFSGCTSLTSIPSGFLPATVLSLECYESMFSHCTSLATVPQDLLPATTFDNDYDWACYEYMFEYCTSLRTAPVLPATTLTRCCYRYMFRGCSSLNYIKCLATDISAEECTSHWVSGVSSSGTFIKNSKMNSWLRGGDGIPNNWTIQNDNESSSEKDEVAFAIDGISYQGTKSEKTVVVKAVDTKQTSIEIPVSVSYDGTTYKVTGIADDAFKGSNMGALIWDVEAALPNNAFSNASIGSNFLLYVKSSSYAPSSVKNVVVDGTAQAIVLSDDGGQFYCPQAFTARRISYSHNYSMETGKGSTMGWETIALPFDVQRIIHSIQGEVVPFAAYSSGSNQKPFWLAYMSAGGFKRTADIRANEAYIIAMPNNSSYQDNYILAGDVTFSAENITVPKTPTFNGTFLPAFSIVAKSSSVYALNVNNRYIRYSGSEKPGSIFIRDLRDVRPFEAYLTGNFTRGIIEINFDNGTTDILDVLLSTDDSQEMTIHTLSGQQIIRTTQRDFDIVWQQLHKGVYIVNGKKMIK